MKIFKYILKRILIGVGIILIMSFINKCDVSALRTNGFNYNTPPNAQFYNVVNPSNYSVSPTQFNSSYGTWSSSIMTNLGGANDAYGATICLSLDSALQNGYLYSISVLLHNPSAVSYQVVSTDNYTMMRGGYSFSTAMSNSGSISLKYFGSNKVTSITNSLDNQGFIMNYIFVPNNPYHVLCMPFKTSSQTSVIHSVLGYHIDVIGNTKGLSSSDVQSAVNNAINSTNNKVDNLSSKLSVVETNLATQIQQTKYELNNKLTEINDTMSDDSTDDPDGKINEASSKVATDNVISQLVLLPVTLFTKVLTSLNSTCVNYNLGELYGHNLTMPCINIQLYVGSFLWNTIDVLISGLLIYAISRKFVKVFNELSQMKEGDIID